VLQRQLTQ